MKSKGLRSLRQDRGTSLVLVLAFLAGFGLFSSVLVYQIDVHEKVTESVRGINNSSYAADGGLEFAVDALRQNPNYCPNAAAGTMSLGTVPVNGTSVTVECQAYGSGDAGPGYGPGQYAIITTGTGANSFQTQSGGTPIITGLGSGTETPHSVAVFVAGSLNLLQDVQIRGGDVDKQQTTLSSPQCSTVPHLDMTPPYQYCTTVAQTPDFPNSLPASHPSAAPIFWDKNGNCRVFYPGLYATAPALKSGKNNYFASGLYYFQNVGQLQVDNGTTVVGGAPGSDIPATGFPAACATDAEALGHTPGATVTGSGVKFILGGNSSLSDKNGSAELFTRVPPVGASEGASGFSIQEVRASQSDAFWRTPSLGSANILETITGNNNLAVHGKVYVPEGPVQLFATNATVGQLDGGIVAKTLLLQSSNSISPGGFAVSAAGGGPVASARTIRIRATPAGGGAPYQGVVTISPGAFYAQRAATVVSWRKCSQMGC